MKRGLRPPKDHASSFLEDPAGAPAGRNLGCLSPPTLPIPEILLQRMGPGVTAGSPVTVLWPRGSVLSSLQDRVWDGGGQAQPARRLRGNLCGRVPARVHGPVLSALLLHGESWPQISLPWSLTHLDLCGQTQAAPGKMLWPHPRIPCWGAVWHGRWECGPASGLLGCEHCPCHLLSEPGQVA